MKPPSNQAVFRVFDDGVGLRYILPAQPGLAAFEVMDTLGDAPDALFIPVGNAGNITAYWLGFRRYLDGLRGSEEVNCLRILALAPADIAALEHRTEGWIAGLQLAEPLENLPADRLFNVG